MDTVDTTIIRSILHELDLEGFDEFSDRCFSIIENVLRANYRKGFHDGVDLERKTQ